MCVTCIRCQIHFCSSAWHLSSQVWMSSLRGGNGATMVSVGDIRSGLWCRTRDEWTAPAPVRVQAPPSIVRARTLSTMINPTGAAAGQHSRTSTASDSHDAGTQPQAWRHISAPATARSASSYVDHSLRAPGPPDWTSNAPVEATKAASADSSSQPCSVHGPSLSISAREVVLQCNTDCSPAQMIATATVSLVNTGTTALYVEWRQASLKVLAPHQVGDVLQRLEKKPILVSE